MGDLTLTPDPARVLTSQELLAAKCLADLCNFPAGSVRSSNLDALFADDNAFELMIL